MGISCSSHKNEPVHHKHLLTYSSDVKFHNSALEIDLRWGMNTEKPTDQTKGEWKLFIKLHKC